ncbi:MAG TPA: phosphotransferase [Anaerolineales bacterium]|nr:phosphotransferase [Anaerolineales bacterium]HLO29703.1 phosphotransferase [Anaerolineales bacterium]
MYQHKYFNLRLHDNVELEEILRVKIVERRTLHEWPLSCVEQVITAEGSKWVYKSQFGPTVEPQFYANAKSKLLVAGKTLYQSKSGFVNMLFEFIEAPRMEDLKLSDNAIVAAWNNLSQSIAEIEGKLPYYHDISEQKLWRALMETMLENLEKLVFQGSFQRVDNMALRKLRIWTCSEEILAALGKNVGFVHNDLSNDNIFVLPDGYRIIDWQRPIISPKELDLAALLASLNRETRGFVDQRIVWIMYLLRIEWFTECAVRWFPEGQDYYDSSIHRLINLIGKSA